MPTLSTPFRREGLARAVALAAAAALALAGCGADDPPEPAPTVDAEAVAESSYLTGVRETLPGTTASDDALLLAGRNVCDALDRGETPEAVYVTVVETDPQTGPVVLGAAVSTLCREHMAAVQAMVGDGS